MQNPFNSFLTDPIVKIVLTVALWAIVLVILPNTPFMQFLENFADLPYLGYLNWFLPIGSCLTVMAVWWTAVVVYYGISWILRQINAIGM